MNHGDGDGDGDGDGRSDGATEGDDGGTDEQDAEAPPSDGGWTFCKKGPKCATVESSPKGCPARWPKTGDACDRAEIDCWYCDESGPRDLKRCAAPTMEWVAVSLCDEP